MSASHGRGGLAVVLGVANHRSIAWACVQSFLAKGTDCIVTYQSNRFAPTIQKLIEKQHQEMESGTGDGSRYGRVLASFPCNVGVDGELERLFEEQVPATIEQNSHHHTRRLDALVHSIAYANFEKRPFSHASWDAFAESQRISAYSFLQAAHLAKPLMSNTNTSTVVDESRNAKNLRSPSMTALTYLGSIRSVPNYHIMAPAKASLESIVRGLAMEFGQGSGCSGSATAGSSSGGDTNNNDDIIRVNAVSAGPVSTLAARGIPKFAQLYKQVAEQSPLGRPVEAQEVADTVRFVATEATAITGQIIYVDGGYSSIVPIVASSPDE